MTNLKLYFYGRKRKKREREVFQSCMQQSDNQWLFMIKLSPQFKCLIRSDPKSLAFSKFEFLSDTNYFIMGILKREL